MKHLIWWNNFCLVPVVKENETVKKKVFLIKIKNIYLNFCCKDWKHSYTEKQIDKSREKDILVFLYKSKERFLWVVSAMLGSCK